MDDPVDPWFSPEKATAWTAIKHFHQHWLPPIMALGSLLWLAYTLLSNPPRPPVGAYIAVLAAMAVIVTIWPPESNWSKAAWLAVFFALTGLEIATLYKDRGENQQQQADARKKESDAFQLIADGLTAALTQSRDAFAATMTRMEGLARLSSENIQTVTGGDSFCYLTMMYLDSPVLQNGTPVVIHMGKYPLSDVEARVVDLVKLARQKGPPDFFGDFVVRPGNLPVGKAWFDRSVTIPFSDPNKQDFNIFFVAKNGSWSEALKFRRVDKKWQIALSVRIEIMPKTKTGKMTNKKVFELVSQQFPREELGADWGR